MKTRGRKARSGYGVRPEEVALAAQACERAHLAGTPHRDAGAGAHSRVWSQREGRVNHGERSKAGAGAQWLSEVTLRAAGQGITC